MLLLLVIAACLDLALAVTRPLHLLGDVGDCLGNLSDGGREIAVIYVGSFLLRRREYLREIGVLQLRQALNLVSEDGQLILVRLNQQVHLLDVSNYIYRVLLHVRFLFTVGVVIAHKN